MHQNRYPLAIASSSPRKIIDFVIKQFKLKPYFKIIVSGDDFKKSKPHPEIFLKAASALQLDVKECVVFEDSLAGVQAAKAGGFLCVGIDRHNHPENYKLADLYVTDLTSLNYSVLEGLFM